VRAWFIAQGHDVAADDDVYHEAHHQGIWALSQGPQRGADNDPVFWQHYDDGYLTAIGILEPDLELARVSFRRLFEESAEPVWSGELAANIEAFGRIANSGMPVAIVSNNDGTAEEQLVRHRVCQVGPGPLPSVVCVVDSTVVGVSKPDPAIFTPALTALGVKPSQALYVGDTVHADVVGARAAGLQVVQLDPYGLHADFDHHRLADLAALAAWLGL
jgi:putative hydrolase of the HAD superfamily